MLTLLNIAQLFLFTCLMSLGQILFKKTALTLAAGSSTQQGLSLVDGILKALTVPWLYLALTVYAIATVFWLYLLQRIPLSLAYPFSAIAMVLVPIAAVLLFEEKLTIFYWLGVFFILLGMFFIAK